MFVRIIVFVFAFMNFGASETKAFTLQDAQVCADKLLDAYNSKTYPRNLLAIESIVATAFGTSHRFFSASDVNLALTVGEEHIQESFTEPTGKYKYQGLVVETVEKTNSGYRVKGVVVVTSPKANGRYSFLALVTGEGCKVRQVRIADVMTLVDQLKKSLGSDPRVKRLFDS
jgi:hypothetical protein